MAHATRGRSIPLTVGRRLVEELLHHAKQVPSLPLSRDCQIAPLALARACSNPSPSWTALFMKGYALAALRYPPLRQSYIRYPRPHLYEHPGSDCALLVEREVDGEPTVLAAKVFRPEATPITLIDQHVRHFRTAPVRDISPFRQALRLGRAPKIFRRAIVWSTLHLSGFKRAKRFGTFMMSSLGNHGVEQIHPLTPLTTYFTFGPIASNGRVTLKVVYDHRVLDGRTAARALEDLEAILNGEVASELRSAARKAA